MSSPVVSLAVIAKLFNLTGRRVQQLVAEGIIPRAEKGKYELVPCVRGYISYLQERAVGKSVEDIDTNKERGRLLKAQADKVDLEVAALRGELVPIDKTQAVWTAYLANCRAKLLAIPHKLAPRVLLAKEVAEVQAIIEGEIHECLTELAGGDGIPEQDIESAADDAENLGAATEIDGERVGRSIPSA
jgi:phage terminase Nu1 subunit (DNA packaging protein)